MRGEGAASGIAFALRAKAGFRIGSSFDEDSGDNIFLFLGMTRVETDRRAKLPHRAWSPAVNGATWSLD